MLPSQARTRYCNCISRSSCFSTYLWSCKTYTSNKFPEVLKYVFCLLGITVRCNCTSTCVCPSFINETTNSHRAHTHTRARAAHVHIRTHTIRKGKILAKLVAPGYSNSQGIHPSRQLTAEPSTGYWRTSPTAQTTARWILCEFLSKTWADRAGQLGYWSSWFALFDHISRVARIACLLSGAE